MVTNELLTLLNKLKSGEILNHELVRLQHLLDSREGLKDFLEKMDLDYEQIQQEIQHLPKYHNQEQTKNRILTSISQASLTKPTKKLSKRVYSWALVASLVIAGIFLYQKKEKMPEAISWETIQTKHGEQKQIRLSDETEVKLNGNSSLSYATTATGQLRIVKLRGEAFFEVAKNPEKPFLVLAKDFVTKVVGTSFNIDSDIERSVEVNSGLVKVFEVDESNYEEQLTTEMKDLPALIEKSSQKAVALSKGQRAVLTEDSWEVKTFNTTNWYNKELVHFNEKLDLIVKKAYRYYGDSVIVAPEIAGTKMTISFKNKDIKQVLQTLADINDAKLLKKTDKLWEIKK